MRWQLPFVSRLAYDGVVAERDRLLDQLVRLATRHDTTLRDVMDLAREARLAPALPEPLKSPLAALGPKAHAALQSMGRGQSPEVRRGMQVAALALHAEGLTDDALAQRILDGEPVRL